VKFTVGILAMQTDLAAVVMLLKALNCLNFVGQLKLSAGNCCGIPISVEFSSCNLYLQVQRSIATVKICPPHIASF
jgi:hypothetical protein